MTVTDKRKYHWSRFDEDSGVRDVGTIVGALADQIVRLRCKRCPVQYEAWKIASAGGSKPAGPVAVSLHAFLEPVVGLPGGAPISLDHLEGFVAEQLWYFVLNADATRDAVVRIEVPSYRALDHGGDGLAVRRNPDGTLTFFLWEIKKKTGKGKATGTITRAIKQLKTQGIAYLARYTCTVEDTADAEIETLYAHLAEHWAAASPSAGAGVAVATSASLVPSNCFSTMPKHFAGLVLPPRLFGQVTAFLDFGAFAVSVRDKVWTGL